MLHASATTPTLVSTDDLENEIRYFPLDANLHEALGLRFLTHGQASRGWDEFRIADKLDPISWQLPATQAWIGGQYSAGISLHFWALALERAGHSAPEIFPVAYKRTAATSPTFWKNFAHEHPEFLGIYSECVSDPAEARAAYEEWWKIRGAAKNLAPFEVRYFYTAAAKWGTSAQLDAWMKAHPELAATDFEDWAELLHHWKNDAAAWRVLAASIKEPAFPAAEIHPQSEMLEANWIANPSDFVNAQELAADYARRGDAERSSKIVYSIAAQKNAPPWFVDKAAWLYAKNRDYASAVGIALHDPVSPPLAPKPGQKLTDIFEARVYRDSDGRRCRIVC